MTDAVFDFVRDRFHNLDYIKVVLDKIIVNDMDINVHYTNDAAHLSEDRMAAYKTIIILRDGFDWPNGYLEEFDGIPVISYSSYIPVPDMQPISKPTLPNIDKQPQVWITAEQGVALKEYMEKGGCVLFLHNSSHISLTNKDFRDVQGGKFLAHTPAKPFPVEITNKNHSITKGVSDFVVTDEQHFVQFDKESEHVFMHNKSLNGESFICPKNGDLGTSSAAGWLWFLAIVYCKLSHQLMQTFC